MSKQEKLHRTCCPRTLEMPLILALNGLPLRGGGLRLQRGSDMDESRHGESFVNLSLSQPVTGPARCHKQKVILKMESDAGPIDV